MLYKISDLAKLLNVSTNTVRRYEEKGYIKSIRDDGVGYRYYEEDAIVNFTNVRLLRKYGFTHDELKNVKKYDFEKLVDAYSKRLDDMDAKITYLTQLRHRLKDDLVLMRKVDVFERGGYINNCVQLRYILYKKGEELLNEIGRLEEMQRFLDATPEVQRIYLIRKDDFEKGNIVLNLGWAMKEKDVKKYNISSDSYQEVYEKRKSLMVLAKIPVDTSIISRMSNDELKAMLFKEHLEYMSKNNLKLCGDIVGIVIANAIEDDKDVQYVLVSLPIE